MKITKFNHSTILVQDEKVGLFDPGVFTWNDEAFSLDQIEHVDEIIITHAHPDHCHLPFIHALLDKFPEAHIVANHEIKEILTKEGINAAVQPMTEATIPFEAPHESIKPLGSPIENTGYHFAGKYTHPGDSHSFYETKDILAMPFVAPWGAPLAGAKKVLALKPKKVIAIHDWFFAEEGKKWLHERLAPVLEEEGIEFIHLENGASVEL